MIKKAQIGDILEIPTRKGLAYVQFSHYHESPPHYGAIIRVLEGFFQERPKEFHTLAGQRELYYTLFPVQAAVNRKIFQIVGHTEVPLFAKNFPLFRAGNTNPQSGKVDQWWLWDGTKSWKTDELTNEQLDLPIKSSWNDVLLISRIEQGWTPRKSESFTQAARLRNQVRRVPTLKGIKHFLLFKTRKMANEAMELLKGNTNFELEIIDSGSGFTLIARQGMPLTEEYVESATIQLAEIATQTGGTYDAWETAI